MGSLNIHQIQKLQQKLNQINWQNNINIATHNDYFIQQKKLSYWIKYKQSMTKALSPSNFDIHVLYNDFIENIWYRHVLIYVADKPFIYAITKTKYPQKFNLLNLGKKSIGTKLFSKFIQKDNFKYTKNQQITQFINDKLGINIKAVYARQRNFISISKSLSLQEYFIIN